MSKYTTLLIDDEQIARKRLRRLLDDFDDSFQIIGEAKNGDEGLIQIQKLQPDLIFLDIQMPGKTGFEMLQELDEFPIVIFCTAYEEFALQAFDTLALDYLVKPVEKMRLKLTVDKLKRLASNTLKPQIDALLDLVKRQNEIKTLFSIPYKIGDRIILVKSEKISHFVASEKYVEFFTVDSKKHITDLSLKRLEECLPKNFSRVHRSTIVNTAYIKEFRKYFRGKYIVILDDLKNTRIETGRSYSEKIHELIHFE